MSKDDVASVTRLTHQLGYPLSADEVSANIDAVLGNEHHDAFVAVDGDNVVGWVGVKHAFQIESPPFCEIHGLVVDDKCRQRGVGKLLIEKAKQWGKEKGDKKVRLRCNVRRTGARLFYEHLGFKETKEQKVYEIGL